MALREMSIAETQLTLPKPEYFRRMFCTPRTRNWAAADFFLQYLWNERRLAKPTPELNSFIWANDTQQDGKYDQASQPVHYDSCL